MKIIFLLIVLCIEFCHLQSIIILEPKIGQIYQTWGNLPISWSTLQTTDLFSVSLYTANNTLYEIVSNTVSFNPQGFLVFLDFFFTLYS